MKKFARHGFARLGLPLTLILGAGLGALSVGVLERRAPAEAVYVTSAAPPCENSSYTLAIELGSFGSRQLGSEFGGDLDRLHLDPRSGSITLCEDCPVYVAVQRATLEVGYTGRPTEGQFTVRRSLTVAGVTRELVQPARVGTGMHNDSVYLATGEAVTYPLALSDGRRATLEVTPMGESLMGTSDHTLHSTPLYAAFLLRDVGPQ